MELTDTKRSRAGAAVQALASLLWLPQAGFLAYAVGRIAQGAPAREAIVPAIAVLLIGIARAMLDAAGIRFAFASARASLTSLRTEAVRVLASRSPMDSRRISSGEAASIIAEQAEAILPYLSRFKPVRFRVMAVPIAILCAVLWFSWTAALVLLLAAPLIPIFMALIGWRAKAASEEQLVEMGGMNGFLLDRLRGLSTIRAFKAVDATANDLRARADDLRRRTMAVLRIAFMSSAVLELFAALGVAMVAVYVGFHLLGQLPFGAWGARLSLSEGLFILLLAPAFFEPLRDLSGVWHDRASGEAALASIKRIALDEDGTLLPGANAGETKTARGPASIAVEQIDFSYAGETARVFQDFDFQAKPGEHIALMGPSGAGKSTLLSLIAGLAPIDSGRIRIGGVPLDDRNVQALRNRIAWVGQKPHIFAGSVRANITVGRLSVDSERLSQALETARLDDLSVATQAFELGEGGVGISGGEALRLSLARAFADPGRDIILADEPTAHLDATTAAEIAERLIRNSEGKTLIVATHDEAFAARMDRIVRIGDATISKMQAQSMVPA
ncbi:thiol reductant ABC exporter subunit CydD [Mesorhizobium sp. SB112]|uniref:thiol reductant ABC exporter subunit CydD n=1 Tax=Mesorhizobium sp. SB112 TaxID=3151853 RepID=UPI003262F0D1